jgi:Flp pilus assembly protein TadG
MPLVALALVTLLATAGLAVDMGYMRYQKRLMQTAADAAALAAATDENLGDPTQYQNDALAVAAANGFQDGVNNTTVAVNNPAPGGISPGTAIQVVIQKQYPAIFMQVVGIPNSTLSAAGTATLSVSPNCLAALDPAGTGLTLNAGVSAGNCGLMSNGPLSGSGDITAAYVGVVGSSGGYGGSVSPNTISTVLQPAADPLSYLVPPTPAGTCTDENLNGMSGPAMDGVVTLTPGTYCEIIIDSGAVVTFDAGLYILNGSNGFQIKNTGTATNNSGGVTFYNTGSGAITFNGTGAVNLSASTSPVDTLPAGILFYQDPGDVAPADLSEGASGNVQLSGTLYLPTATVTIAGSVTGTNAVTVAGSITVTGSTLLTVDSPTVPGGSPLQSVALVQ